MYCNPGIWRCTAQEFASIQIYILYLFLKKEKQWRKATGLHRSYMCKYLPPAVILYQSSKCTAKPRNVQIFVLILLLLLLYMILYCSFFNKMSVDNQYWLVIIGRLRLFHKKKTFKVKKGDDDGIRLGFTLVVMKFYVHLAFKTTWAQCGKWMYNNYRYLYALYTCTLYISDGNIPITAWHLFDRYFSIYLN